MQKYRQDDLRLKAIHQVVEGFCYFDVFEVLHYFLVYLCFLICILIQENGEGLKEPQLIVYKYKDPSSSIDYSSSDYIGDLEGSGNVGDNTALLESSRNGWYC